MRKLLWFIAGGFTTLILVAKGHDHATKNGEVIHETDDYQVIRMKYSDGQWSNYCWYKAKEKVEES